MSKSKKNIIEYAIFGIFAIFIAVSFMLDFEVGKELSTRFFSFSRQMLITIPCIFLLIGLIDVWIPEEWVRKRIGEGSGIKGSLYVILLAMLQGGPLYSAFPTAHIMWKKGSSLTNVFLYLGAFSSLKLPMMLFEISFLGWKFTLIRGIIAIPLVLMNAEIITLFAKKKGLTIKKH